jgi:hypothetical protein
MTIQNELFVKTYDLTSLQVNMESEVRSSQICHHVDLVPVYQISQHHVTEDNSLQYVVLYKFLDF